MRDTERIKKFCDELAEIWQTQYPNWTFGRLIINVFSKTLRDPFFVEEDEMIKIFKDFFHMNGEENNK